MIDLDWKPTTPSRARDEQSSWNPSKAGSAKPSLKNSLSSRARRNRGNRPEVLRIEVRSQPNLQRVCGVCTKVLVRTTGKMAESAKYIWCQHCYTGWIAKEDKPYYPKCWSCGMGWRKRARRPRWWSAEDAWDAQWPHTYPAQEVGYYPPPGLGRPARTPMTTAEYRTAVGGLQTRELSACYGQQGSHRRTQKSMTSTQELR